MLTDISNIKKNAQNMNGNENQLKCYINKTLQTMKIQLRALKRQNQLQKSHHQHEVHQYKQQITNLKKKISNFSEKQIIKVLMNADEDLYTKNKLTQLQTKNNEQSQLIKLLKAQNQTLKQKLHHSQQNSMSVKNQLQACQYQKQKHLQINITQKIQLQQKIDVFKSEIKSKGNIIENLKNQIDKVSQKEYDLIHQERKIKKKIDQINMYQKQMKDVNKFNQQKVQAKMSKVIKQNQFLKSHIKKIQKNDVLQCKCSSEVQNFKNKYINKSRQLSKTKIQLSKEIFKEDMSSKLKKSLQKSSDLLREEDQILFKLTENSDHEDKQAQDRVNNNWRSSTHLKRN